MIKVLIVGSIALLFTQCTNKIVQPEVSVNNMVVEKQTISSDSLHSFATETKKLLMKNVGEQMKIGGPESALEFCNKHGLVISRVSDKMRNPKNVANSEELKLIEQYKKQLLAGDLLKPVRTETHYYEPLVTNAMCLQCHGEPVKNVQPKVATKIADLYPNDLAMGYKENEVRGLISIKVK